MPQFDEDKQNKKIDEIRKNEEEDVVQILAENRYGLPYVNMTSVVVENEPLRYITEERARASGIAPFKLAGKNIHVAIRTPENPDVVTFKQELEEKGFVPHFYMASGASLEKVWSRFAEISRANASRIGGIDISGDTIAEVAEHVHTLAEATDEVNKAIHGIDTHRTSHILELIVAGGIALNASDIHIEPEEESVRLRYRLDGVLQDVTTIDYKIHHLLNSRIKLISGLKLTSQAIAQDGRFSIFLNDDEISMRVSLVPGAYGEGIVMRILNPKSIQVKLEEMGIDTKVYDVMMRDIARPNGLILLTGPTGSGKTTTLYAFLQRIYTPGIKIITIEDPIEYHLKGITQTQVEHDKGYNFAEGLRAALRQDPDVIMVGEIRDEETAKIAVESALTGHLVFSTLHTNSASGVIPRLIDLAINPKIMVSALTLSIAQRLVRKLCKECKKAVTTNEKDTAVIDTVIARALETGKEIASYNVATKGPYTVYEAVGCQTCNFTGYKGRMGLFEAIETTEAIEKIIPENPSERQIKETALGQKTLTMREDGIIKVLTGRTSLEEVMGVVDVYEE